MKVLEFQTQITSAGTLKLPPDIAAQIPGDDRVRVVLVFGDSSEDADWKRLTADRFLAGYSQGDDLYDTCARPRPPTPVRYWARLRRKELCKAPPDFRPLGRASLAAHGQSQRLTPCRRYCVLIQ